MIFISYARSDGEFALRLATSLEQNGADVWIDQLDIRAGTRWDRSVEEALGRSDCCLAVMTPASVGSVNVMDEVAFSLDENKVVIPLLVDRCSIPLRLRRLQYIDFTIGFEKGLERLIRVLPAERRTTVEEPAPVAPSHRPEEREEERNPVRATPEAITASSSSPSAGAGLPKVSRDEALIGSSAEKKKGCLGPLLLMSCLAILAGLSLTAIGKGIATIVEWHAKDKVGTVFGAVFILFGIVTLYFVPRITRFLSKVLLT